MQGLIAGLVVAGLSLHPTQSIEPPSAGLVRMLATACSGEGGFDHAFGAQLSGNTSQAIEADGGLIGRIDLETTRRSGQIYEISALLSYERYTALPIEERQAAAWELLDQVNLAIAEAGVLTDPVEDEDGDVTWTAPGSDVTVQIAMAGRVGIYVICTDASLKALNFDEALGRTRVERPIRPALALPPRPAADVCGTPEGDTLVDGLETIGQSTLEYSQAGSNYSEHMAQWYGQQLIDAGVWTEARSSEFALSAIQVPAIAGEFSSQMERLNRFLGDLVGSVEARDVGDRSTACALALRTLNTVHDMHESNERQWAVMLERYQAEGRRLGVTLD